VEEYEIDAEVIGEDTARTNQLHFIEFFSDTPYTDATITVTFEDDFTWENPNLIEGGFRVQRLKEIQEYAWNHRNQLVEVDVYVALPGSSEGPSFDNPGTPDQPVTTWYRGHVDYLYDVFGQRIGKEFGDEGGASWGPHMNTYYVNERGHTVILLDPNGQPRRRRLYAPGVDQILAVDNGPSADDGEKIIWALTDQQGTVRNVASKRSDGISYNSLGFDAFGAPTYGVAPGIDVRHAGRDYDEETDLYYNRARYYDPPSGRFVSEDPIGFAAGDVNLYRYCGNSPTNATDPTGQWIDRVVGAVVGAIHGALDVYAANWTSTRPTRTRAFGNI